VGVTLDKFVFSTVCDLHYASSHHPFCYPEFGRIPLDPAEDGGMITCDSASPQELSHVASAQRLAEIPPHSAEDDLGFKMAPFKEAGTAHGRSPVSRGQRCTDPCTRSLSVLVTEPNPAAFLCPRHHLGTWAAGLCPAHAGAGGRPTHERNVLTLWDPV
jgi:hypothetical protein